jgi:hypothetical protein
MEASSILQPTIEATTSSIPSEVTPPQFFLRKKNCKNFLKHHKKNILMARIFKVLLSTPLKSPFKYHGPYSVTLFFG